MRLIEKTLAELSDMLESGEITSRELTEMYLAEIEKVNPELNAYVHVCPDVARRMADESDARRKNGESRGALDGMPISLKDVVCTVEAPTTACSNILKGFQSPYDATLWQRLKAAGAVLLGKVNTDEFTMGSSTQTSAYGVAKNPHDLTRVSGGSSGGSAAAVAAHLCAASIGTDTGGSIRQPAHFCGIAGLKPTYGRGSRWGTIPMASGLDCPGPMAKTTLDCAIVMQAIAGLDEKDSTTVPAPVPDYVSELEKPVKGLRVGIPVEYTSDGTSPEVTAAVEATKQKIIALGGTVTEVSLPHTKYGPAVYYVLAPSEIAANMARYDGLRFGVAAKGRNLEEIYKRSRAEGLGDEVKRRIMIGNYVLSAGHYEAYYQKAQRVRTLIKQDFDKAFETVDVILSPVSPTPAFTIGSKGSDPVEMYLEDIFSIPSNLAGICAIATPVTKTAEGLPVGVQLMGPQLGEATIMRLSHALETN